MNYKVVKSALGGIWVGKTDQKVDNKQVFSEFERARQIARLLIEESIEDEDQRNLMQYDLDDQTRETCEEVPKGY